MTRVTPEGVAALRAARLCTYPWIEDVGTAPGTPPRPDVCTIVIVMGAMSLLASRSVDTGHTHRPDAISHGTLVYPELLCHLALRQALGTGDKDFAIEVGSPYCAASLQSKRPRAAPYLVFAEAGGARHLGDGFVLGVQDDDCLLLLGAKGAPLRAAMLPGGGKGLTCSRFGRPRVSGRFLGLDRLRWFTGHRQTQPPDRACNLSKRQIEIDRDFALA